MNTRKLYSETCKKKKGISRINNETDSIKIMLIWKYFIL